MAAAPTAAPAAEAPTAAPAAATGEQIGQFLLGLLQLRLKFHHLDGILLNRSNELLIEHR